MRSEPTLRTTLGAICAHQGGAIQTGPFGSQLHASDYVETGTPVIMPADIVDGRVSTESIARVGPEHVERLSQHQLRHKDIVFSRRGDVTRFARVSVREVGWLCGTGCIKVRVGHGDLALPEWIALVLDAQDVKEWLVRHAVGATMPNLNTSILGAVPLEVPPVEQQRKAVRVCFALDDRVDLLRQTNATLESIAKALFKSWFIDFDPVRAKAEGREPEGMDAATAALFPAEFEESALGPIPKGWSGGQLESICTNARVQAKPGQMPTDTTYIGLEHMPRKSIALDSAGTAEGLESGKFWFERNDVLFGKLRPYFHKVGLAPCRGVCSTDILVLRPKAAEWLGFLAMHAASDALISHTTQLSNGAKMPRTSWHDVGGFGVVLPPLNVAAAFNALVSPMFERINANIEAVRVLAELRDTLLPRLISGKLLLPDDHEKFEEALA